MLGEDVKQKLAQFFNRLLQKERQANMESLLQESRRWQPQPTNTTYYDEMETRMNYMRGAMQADMNDELKRRFPQTHEKIKKEQVNLPLVRKEMEEKSKCFLNTGEIYLIDEDGERVEGKAQDLFQDFVGRTSTWSMLQKADRITQGCHRCAVKSWWDDRREKLRYSIWPPHKVYIVPDPWRWWDYDSSWAVLFELPGLEGLTAQAKRYEVWGIRDPQAAAVTGRNTVHFVTDGANDTYFNQDDVIPFTDPRTGNPLYPFVWWQDDDSTDLYTVGDEDMLTINRAINSGLTDIRQAIHYKAFGVWVHTMAENGQPLNVKTLGPSQVLDLVAGETLENVDTNLPVEETFDFYQELAEVKAMLSGLPSTSMRKESGAPETGYAIKLRNKPLQEHREEMLTYQLPAAEESVYRALVVSNTYAKDKIKGLEKYRVKIDPGEMDIEEEPEAEGRRLAAEIESDVSTPVDWRMVRYREDREQAEAAVEENVKYNQERSKSRASTFAPMANQFANQLEEEEEEKPEQEGNEDEGREEKDKDIS